MFLLFKKSGETKRRTTTICVRIIELFFFIGERSNCIQSANRRKPLFRKHATTQPTPCRLNQFSLSIGWWRHRCNVPWKIKWLCPTRIRQWMHSQCTPRLKSLKSFSRWAFSACRAECLGHQGSKPVSGDDFAPLYRGKLVLGGKLSTAITGRRWAVQINGKVVDILYGVGTNCTTT